jgi:hypothetical protein
LASSRFRQAFCILHRSTYAANFAHPIGGARGTHYCPSSQKLTLEHVVKYGPRDPSHLTELYGIDVSPDLISRVTDAVLDELREWQNRPLDPVYPIVFFDALRVKIRDEGLVKNKAVYVALAFNANGEKEVLGLWIEQTEGAKFWLKVVNELKARGVSTTF